MTSQPTAGAGTVTVGQVLAYLDTDFRDLAAGVADGTYAIWLGSGLSIEKVDGLSRIIERALARMHAEADPHDSNCPYSRALRRSVQIAGLPAKQAAEVNTTLPPGEWLHKDAVISAISRNYAKFLDIRIGTNAPDFVLWDLVDVRATYADPAILPDAQHSALALLAVEGHAPEILTANWDGLIESAFEELGRLVPSDLKVCVRADDLVGPASRSRLIKFHGCAMRAAQDPDTYRPLLIHQDSQIADYANNPHYSGIRNQIVALATSRPTLMIGLSAQDADIKAIFAEAGRAHAWHPGTNPHAVVFAENDLGADQGTILRAAYGAAFDDDPIGIEDAAVIHTYAQPLLTALVLHVLAAKVRAIAELAKSSLPAPELAQLLDGVRALRDAVAPHGDRDAVSFVAELARTLTAMLATARGGAVPAGPDARYSPIAAGPIHLLRDDENIASNGLPEAAMAIALLGYGMMAGAWQVAPTVDGDIRLSKAGTTHKVFVAASDRAAVALLNSGTIDSRSPDMILVHASNSPNPASRRPRRPPGRTGARALREVRLPELLDACATTAELDNRFREAIGV